MSSASGVSLPTIKLTIDHDPIDASYLVGQWARTAHGIDRSLYYAREIVYIHKVSGKNVFATNSQGVDACLYNGGVNMLLTDYASGWTQISIQEDAMKFLYNRVVEIIEDDKVAAACKTAIRNLTKCFAQTKPNTKTSIFNWPHEVKFEPPTVNKYNLPSLPDSAPLKALADWCEKDCPEAVADVQVLRAAFGDFEITKKKYIPRPSNQEVYEYRRFYL